VVKYGRLVLVPTEVVPMGPKHTPALRGTQMLRAAHIARKLILGGFRPQHAFVGPDAISRHMAESILAGTNSSVGPTPCDRLEDRKWGVMRELGATTIDRTYSQEVQQNWLTTWKGAPHGGESLRQMRQRVVPFIQQPLMPTLRQGNVLLVVPAWTALVIRTSLEHGPGIPEISLFTPLWNKTYVFGDGPLPAHHILT
jgi:broad specificity phosphatase PhoE